MWVNGGRVVDGVGGLGSGNQRQQQQPGRQLGWMIDYDWAAAGAASKSQEQSLWDGGGAEETFCVGSVCRPRVRGPAGSSSADAELLPCPDAVYR